MQKINRRQFVHRCAKVGGGLAVFSGGLHFPAGGKRIETDTTDIKAIIPMPIQVVIDDVGWWSGQDGSSRQEPYRTGIDRNHVPADYAAIVQLGRALGIRPQAAMILCEWDKENILRELPPSTWMGKNWDNRKWVGPWLEEAADIIRQNRDHFEITIHGVGHEYWQEGMFTRAEWADNNGEMRPRDQVEKHLDYFAKLMEQHKLGTFPGSFVPTAFRHTFGPSAGQDIGIAKILRQRGVGYINTPFSSMHNAEAVSHDAFGFDAGVMTIDRGTDMFDWDVIGASPLEELGGPTCGMHWPNLLHPNPERNSEIVEKWVTFLAHYNERIDTLLAPDSKSFQHQLAHRICTRVSTAGTKIDLDFTLTDKLPRVIEKNELTLKVSCASRLHFRSDTLSIISESIKASESGVLYSLMLRRRAGTRRAQLSFN